jgi:hypothetical protein
VALPVSEPGRPSLTSEIAEPREPSGGWTTLTRSLYNDTIIGDDGPNLLTGGPASTHWEAPGNDRLVGRGGDDALDDLDGAAGTDTLTRLAGMVTTVAVWTPMTNPSPAYSKHDPRSLPGKPWEGEGCSNALCSVRPLLAEVQVQPYPRRWWRSGQ